MKYRVKCIKEFKNKNSNDLRKHFCIPEGEIVDFDIEITQDKKSLYNLLHSNGNANDGSS